MTAHPTLPGLLADAAGLRDTEQSWPLRRRETPYDSPYVSLHVDTIVSPDGDELTRAVVQPRGAVGILAIDDDDRLLLVEQYRHPVSHRLMEIPAGTLDVDGETHLAAAQRELGEEADIQAADWTSLLDLFASPGYTTERWEVYLATGLSPVPDADRTEREAEEADMHQWWIPFDDAVAAALDGRIADAMAVAAILAAKVLRGAGA